jgi:hypothetical protein
MCSGQLFTITASGAANYTFSGGPVVSPSITSSYTVTGKNTAGCTHTALSTVTVTALPVVFVNSAAICLGQSFTLVAGGANTYTYSSGPVVSPTVTSSYSVTGTNSTGCVSSNTAVSSVTVNPLPIVSASTTNTLICEGESVTLTGGGASSYTFSPGGTGTSVAVSPTVATTYTLTGIDINGCSNSTVFTQRVDGCTRIDNLEIKIQNLSFQVYPNPTKGIVNIDLDTDSEVIILNSIGQTVYSSKLGAGRHQVNLEHLANGMYVIRTGNAANSKRFNLIKEH